MNRKGNQITSKSSQIATEPVGLNQKLKIKNLKTLVHSTSLPSRLGATL